MVNRKQWRVVGYFREGTLLYKNDHWSQSDIYNMPTIWKWTMYAKADFTVSTSGSLMLYTRGDTYTHTHAYTHTLHLILFNHSSEKKRQKHVSFRVSAIQFNKLYLSQRISKRLQTLILFEQQLFQHAKTCSRTAAMIARFKLTM